MSEAHRKGEPFRETLWVIFHSKLTFLVFIAWACCLFRWKSSPCSQKPFSRPTSSRLFIWRSPNSSLSFGWWKLRVSLNFHLKERQRCLLLAIRYDPKFWDFERSKHRNEEVIWNRLLEKMLEMTKHSSRLSKFSFGLFIRVCSLSDHLFIRSEALLRESWSKL